MSNGSDTGEEKINMSYASSIKTAFSTDTNDLFRGELRSLVKNQSHEWTPERTLAHGKVQKIMRADHGKHFISRNTRNKISK